MAFYQTTSPPVNEFGFSWKKIKSMLFAEISSPDCIPPMYA